MRLIGAVGGLLLSLLVLSGGAAQTASAGSPPREGPYNAFLDSAPGAYPQIQFEVFDDIDGELIPFRKELRFIDVIWPASDCNLGTGPVEINPDWTFRHVWPLPDGQMAVIEGEFTSRTTVTGTFFSNLDNRYSRCVTGGALPWSGGPCCPTKPDPQPGPPIASGRYVALGDSYSSGEGVPPFERGTDRRRNRCHRSVGAYSRVFAELASEPSSKFPGTYSGFDGLGEGWFGPGKPTFLACSGATTTNLGRLAADGAGIEGRAQHNEPAVQLEQLAPEQWWFTDLITLTIGGNDANFGGVLAQCLFRSCHQGMRAEAIIDRIANEVPPLLAGAYAGIRRLAPNASVIALGYPQLFPDDPRKPCSLGKRPISRAKQAFLRKRGDQLNRVIANTAAAAGLHYVDVGKAFDGHEPCGPKDEWIHGLVLRQKVWSFHPNKSGQRAYARRLGAYFICLARHGYPFTHFGGIPEVPSPQQPVPEECV